MHIKFVHRANYDLIEEAEKVLNKPIRGFAGQVYEIYVRVSKRWNWFLIGSVVIMKTGPKEMDYKWFYLYIRSFVSKDVQEEIKNKLGFEQRGL